MWFGQIRSTGSLRPVDHRSKSAHHTLSLLVAVCDRSRKSVSRSWAGRQLVKYRSREFFLHSLSPSGYLFSVEEGAFSVECWLKTGRKCVFTHTLSPSGCLFSVEDAGLPVVIRSTTGRIPIKRVFLHSLSQWLLVPGRVHPLTGRVPVDNRSNPDRVHVSATQVDWLMVYEPVDRVRFPGRVSVDLRSTYLYHKRANCVLYGRLMYHADRWRNMEDVFEIRCDLSKKCKLK